MKLVHVLAALLAAPAIATAQPAAPAPPAAPASPREAFLEQRVIEELAADGIVLARLDVVLALTPDGDALVIALVDPATGQARASTRLPQVPTDRDAAVATVTQVAATLATQVAAAAPPAGPADVPPADPPAPPATALRIPRRLVALEGGMTSSDFLSAGVAAYPIPAIAIEGWIGPTELWGTRGFAVAYTHPVLRWRQRSTTLLGGVAGVAELRVGGGLGLKTFASCVFFCVDGDAVDAFARVEATKFVTPHVGGQMVLDAGVSRIDPDDEGAAAELYPFVGFRVGLVFGL
ncbi:MAG: hypothetical protein JNK64_00220 [Myxococcales bacterium]|nr:hypothetical protein [Myxococcales bacterium]